MKPLKSYAPDWLLGLVKRILAPIRRLRRWSRWLRRRRAVSRLNRRIGFNVLTGPFAGLHYVDQKPGSGGPQLLGTFEKELWEVVEKIIDGQCQHLVNIGAAEGYYAVGFLYRQPNMRVTAFEDLSNWRESISRFAAKNEVSHRLSLRGHCNVAALRAAISEGESTVLWIDIEGGERELLDPAVLPVLRTTPILVELHDFKDPEISRIIDARFAPTHSIFVIRQQERERGDLPVVSGISLRTLKFLAWEGRPAKMVWFWMQPRVS